MGDLLRRLCYPLVLPFIVGAVWLHAWAARQEARSFQPHLTSPLADLPGGEGHVVTGPGPGYRLFASDDSVASVDADVDE
jgi:hypothetical protein